MEEQARAIIESDSYPRKCERVAQAYLDSQARLATLEAAASLALDALLAGTMIGPVRGQRAVNALRECGVHWITATQKGSSTDGE